MTVAVGVSLAAHALGGAIWLLAGRPPPAPEVPPTVELVLGNGGAAAPAVETRPEAPSPPAPATASTEIPGPASPAPSTAARENAAPELPAVRLGGAATGPSAELRDQRDRRFRAARANDGNLPPDYPQAAGARGEEGVVTVRMHVDETGRVRLAEVLKSSGSNLLDKVARDRLAGWRFTPARRDGLAVGDVVDLNINFSLE